MQLNTPVERIERFDDRIELTARGRQPERFDEVVVAAHSDQALRMLADPSDAEREVLGAIPYQPNEAVLHTDRGLLPERRRASSTLLAGVRDPDGFEPIEPPAGGAGAVRAVALDLASRESVEASTAGIAELDGVGLLVNDAGQFVGGQLEHHRTQLERARRELLGDRAADAAVRLRYKGNRAGQVHQDKVRAARKVQSCG